MIRGVRVEDMAGGSMEVGLHVPQVGPNANAENVERFARAADEAGFDGLWVFDHVVLQKEQESRYPYSADGKMGFNPQLDFLEPLTQLAFLAGVTKRARLGTSVLVLPMRQPVLHAKIMATIDHLSGGRFVLGAGVGWWEQEYRVLSVPWERRGKRMDECLQLIRALWTEDWVNFRGEFYEAVDWTCNPKPRRPGGIPIWLGGESRKQLERVGKYADGWHATAASLGTLLQDFEVAKEAARAAGRDPAALTLSVEGGAMLAPERLEQAAEGLMRLKGMGLHHVIAVVHPRHLGDATGLIEEFAKKHLPAIQAA
jgi:probable F420-dependent oxidoreductase